MNKLIIVLCLLLSGNIFGLTTEYRKLRKKMDTQLCYEDSHSWDFYSIKAFKTAIKMSEILKDNPENTKKYYYELLQVGGFIEGFFSFPPVKQKALRALSELNIAPQTIKQRSERFIKKYKSMIYTFEGFTRKESVLISRVSYLSRSDPKSRELSRLLKRMEALLKEKPEKILLHRRLADIYYRRKDFKKFLYHFNIIDRDIDAFLRESQSMFWAIYIYKYALDVLRSNKKEYKELFSDLLSKEKYKFLFKDPEKYIDNLNCLEFYIRLFKAPKRTLANHFPSVMFWFSNPKFRRQFDGFAKSYLTEKETLYAILLWKEYLTKRNKGTIFKRQLKKMYPIKDLNDRFQDPEIRRKIRELLQDK